MTDVELNGAANSRTQDIYAATDILRRMMAELRSLRAATTSRLLAIAIDGRRLRGHLDELLTTVRLLAAESEPKQADELSTQALALIKRLDEELGYLASEAERDCGKVPPACDFLGMTG
jgi:hypothetical protein